MEKTKSLVIDVHVHIFRSRGALPKKYWDEIYTTWVGRLGKEVSDERREMFDGTIETLIKDMDEAGVDMCVCSPLDFALQVGQEADYTVWELNEYAAEAQNRYPDRLIGFCNVDPLRPEAFDVLNKCIKDWGLKGVKLFPNSYKVTDPRLEPFFKKINDEFELPVLFHMGTDPAPYLVDYGHPADLERLIVKFPKIRAVAAHLARGYEHLLAAVMRNHPERMYTDISGLQYAYYDSPWYFLQQMRYQMDRNPWAVILGSDWPFNNTPPPPVFKEWVDIIRNLELNETQLALGMKQFTQEEKDRILGKNARRWLRL